MNLLHQVGKKSGWLAVCLQADRVDCVLIDRNSDNEQPRVRQIYTGPVNSPLALLVKKQGWKAYACTTLLTQNEYQLVQAEAPSVPRDEWKSALYWKLKDLLSFPTDSATFDLIEIPTEEFAPGRPRMLMLIAAQNEKLGARMQVLDQAKLNLVAIDVPEMAQRNIAALFETENRGLAFLAFDDVGGLLTVSFKGELYASRHIDISPQQLDTADEERRQQLYERIGLELQRSLDTFDRQYSFITVTRLVMAPRPELGGLKDYLASSLYFPVDLMNLTEVLDCSACPELNQPSMQSHFLYTIGAALRNHTNTNTNPPHREATVA